MMWWLALSLVPVVCWLAYRVYEGMLVVQEQLRRDY